MKLTDAERWILSNQHAILAKLDPNESERYEKIREALDNGYELHYRPENITTNPDEIMTEEECREVLDILTMFQVLRQSFERLADKSGIEEGAVRFDGVRRQQRDQADGVHALLLHAPPGRQIQRRRECEKPKQPLVPAAALPSDAR